MILGFGLGDLWLRVVCPSASEFVDLSLTGDFRVNLLLCVRLNRPPLLSNVACIVLCELT